MDASRKLALLRQILGKETGDNKGVYHFWCPKHGASSGRTVGYLGVHVEDERFNCWSCEWKGGRLTGLFRYGVRRGTCSLTDLEDYLSSSFSAPETSGKSYEPVVIPDEFQALCEPSSDPWTGRAMAYLSSRGVTPDDLVRYRMGFCRTGRYKMRVMFPSFDDEGELNFLVGRSVYPDEPYRYLSGEYDRDIVFNDYLLDWRRPITLVEGPFDMVKAGENTVPLLGTRLSPRSRLFRRLVLSGERVYLALDTDAVRAQQASLQELTRHGVEVLVVPLDGAKDVGGMSHEDYLKLRDRARPVTSSVDVMRERVVHLWA